MEISQNDLERIVRAVETEYGDGEWTSPDMDGGVESCRYFQTREGSYEDFYFYDREGVNYSGDTTLHRLAALRNLPVVALKTFLRHRDQHCYEIFHSRSPLCYSLRIKCNYVGLPHPPRLDQQNKKGATFIHVAVYRNAINVVELVTVAIEAQRCLPSLGK
jgi:hypothetical protein